MTRHKFTWRHVVRRILSLVFSRLVVTGVLLLAQLVWFFILFSRLSEYATWINGAGIAHQRHHVPALIRQDSTVPEFKISWMILFAVMPVQGGLLYLLWATNAPRCACATGWSAPRPCWPAAHRRPRRPAKTGRARPPRGRDRALRAGFCPRAGV